MGVRDWLSDQTILFRRAQDVVRAESELAVATRPGVTLSPLSPWATRRNLSQVAFDPETWGAGEHARPLTVQDALTIPAIKKGRAILHAVLTSSPLVAIRNTDGVDEVLTGKEAPTWLYRSDTEIAPEQRMAGIVDDFLFHEATLVATRRGAVPPGARFGPILDAAHVPYDWWDVDGDTGELLVGDEPVEEGRYLWIPGPSAGLLVEARAEIRQWLDMSRNIGVRLASPAPSIILEDSDTGDADDKLVEDTVEKVSRARRSPNGAVMYVPAGMKATAVSNNDDGSLYIEARNALRIDLANHMNLPVALLDGSPATASLTYSTAEGKRSEFDDLSLDYWTRPLEGALSQDSVVPRGTRIRFDRTARFASTNAPTGAPVQD